MLNIKMLTAAAALASLGIAAPVMAGDTSPDTTIHEESPRAGTGVSVGTDPNAAKHNRGEADDATGDDRLNKKHDSEDGKHHDAMKKDGDKSDDAVAAGREDHPSEAGKEINKTDEAVHESAYKKTYPSEPEVSEIDE